MSEHETTVLGELTALVTEKVAAQKDATKPYVGLEHIPSGGSRLVGLGTAADSISTNNVFRGGDTLFGKLRPRLRKSVQVDFDGYCSTDILVLRPSQSADSDFVSFVLQSDPVFHAAIRSEEGTKMPRCSWESLKNLCVFSPSPKKQRRIAEILETVDEAIEQTEALKAKQQQVKAGLMHDLFTRGVNPAGQPRPLSIKARALYKESPVGWIPKEWDYALLDDVAHRASGHTPNRNHSEYWDGGIKWVSLADSWRLDNVYISETDKEISALGIANSSAVLHPPGIVVLSRDAGIGKSAITTCEMAVSQHFMCWRCGPKLDTHYLYYWLQYRKREFENIATGTTIPTIGLRFFKNYRLPVSTDVNEQKKIGAMLLSADQLVQAEAAHLAKLRQLKQGLMQDLLTGRVAVPA